MSADEPIEAPPWRRRLLETMSAGFFLADLVLGPDGRVSDARLRDTNPAFARLTGLRDVDGRLLSELFPAAEPRWIEHCQLAYDEGEHGPFVDEVRCLGRWFDVTLNRIGNGADRILTGLFRDVTERHREERERERTTERLHHLSAALSESDRRKTEFLATLAHELRNPLAPIRSGLDLIAAHRAEPREIDRTHAMMARQVDHMVQLVDELLDVARIAQGTLELKLRATDLAEVVGSAVDSSRSLIESRNHVLSIDLPSEPISFVVDPVRTTQIVANLLNNAAHYTPPGGRIRLEATGDLEQVHIVVSDDGEGIGEDALVGIFEMFTRAAGDGSHRQGGLGIGLALSRRLAELHGGRLEASSDGTNCGSRFALVLPRRSDPAGSAITRLDVAVGVPTAATRRVLVVDDNVDAEDALARVLALRGFEVRVAHDGRAAVEAVLEHGPGVAFLDIGLPDMTGYELALEIAALEGTSTPTLVALTGWGTRDDRERSRQAGFSHHLTKPASGARVLALLGQIAGDVGRADGTA